MRFIHKMKRFWTWNMNIKVWKVMLQGFICFLIFTKLEVMTFIMEGKNMISLSILLYGPSQGWGACVGFDFFAFWSSHHVPNVFFNKFSMMFLTCFSCSLCVPQDVPNSTALHTIVFAQRWIFITYEGGPKGGPFFRGNDFQNYFVIGQLNGSLQKQVENFGCNLIVLGANFASWWREK
jgi:hypothetical protein